MRVFFVNGRQVIYTNILVYWVCKGQNFARLYFRERREAREIHENEVLQKLELTLCFIRRCRSNSSMQTETVSFPPVCRYTHTADRYNVLRPFISLELT